MAKMETITRMNRTGASASPEEAKKTAEGAREAGPSSKGDAKAIASLRSPYLSEKESLGARPPADGRKVPPILMDKLGDRLAFERGGVRLYEALLGKVKQSRQRGGPSQSDVQHIMEEEAQHFAMVHAAIERLGGDPTIETPAADLSGVASLGIVQVLTDPRTTVAQCLHALLTAELTDNDGWQMLIELTRTLGHNDLAQELQTALKNEQEHLEKVRGWLLTLAHSEAGVKK